jgi:hypothetical protein
VREAFSLSCAAVFAIWILRAGPAELRQLDVSLVAYLQALPLGLVVGSLAAVAGWGVTWLRRATGHLAVTSTLLYAGVLKVLGLALLPWLLLLAVILLTAAGTVRGRPPATAGGGVALLHAMGTLTALYLAVHLAAFTSAWPAFRVVLISLWRLVAG